MLVEQSAEAAPENTGAGAANEKKCAATARSSCKTKVKPLDLRLSEDLKSNVGYMYSSDNKWAVRINPDTKLPLFFLGRDKCNEERTSKVVSIVRCSFFEDFLNSEKRGGRAS